MQRKGGCRWVRLKTVPYPYEHCTSTVHTGTVKVRYGYGTGTVRVRVPVLAMHYQSKLGERCPGTLLPGGSHLYFAILMLGVLVSPVLDFLPSFSVQYKLRRHIWRVVI